MHNFIAVVLLLVSCGKLPTAENVNENMTPTTETRTGSDQFNSEIPSTQKMAESPTKQSSNSPSNSPAKSFAINKPSRATAYYPSSSKMEGGYKDRYGAPLQTLQDFLEGKASYVSVAMDRQLNIPRGRIVRIPEIEKHFQKPIIFKVVDTGGAFSGKGYSRIDICVRSYAYSIEKVVNQNVTLVFE